MPAQSNERLGRRSLVLILGDCATKEKGVLYVEFAENALGSGRSVQQPAGAVGNGAISGGR